MLTHRALALLLPLALLLAILPVSPAAAAPEDDVRALDSNLERAVAAAGTGDLAAARSAFATYEAGWPRVEDGVKARSRSSYRSIEDGLKDVKVAFSTQPIDQQNVTKALVELRQRGDQFVAAGAPTAPSTSSAPAASAAAVDAHAQLVAMAANLDRAEADIKVGEASAAAAEMRAFQQTWPEVEGGIKARSPSVYTSTENSMAETYALLVSTPPDLPRAGQRVAEMRAQLAPFVGQQPSYGVFDAAVIMLREGLEALLVIAALLAVLKKAGRTDQQRWIWGGSLAGVALSVLVAFGAQAAFSRAGAAVGSELLEGIVGLVAAAMLFYVSYWLHQKTRLGAWQRYIHEHSTAALARNSVISLATVAFLAVFREGAETVLFYLGIAPSISTTDLLAGIGLGTGVLAIIGMALLALGLRLPIRPFLLGSSLLIYYLGFKFVGTGIHSLQVAGVLSATPAPLPTNEVLGLFPTWQTALPQLVLLVVALLIAAYSLGSRPARRALTA